MSCAVRLVGGQRHVGSGCQLRLAVQQAELRRCKASSTPSEQAPGEFAGLLTGGRGIKGLENSQDVGPSLPVLGSVGEAGHRRL